LTVEIWEKDPDDLPPSVGQRLARQQSGDPHDHLEERSPFEQDRDRILYSAAFRRLGGVTQIAPSQEGHHFHNRLTHSLKVGQVGRRLAEYLIDDFIEREDEDTFIEEVGHLDPAVVETACLAHDLGHPPFGHVAESALDSHMRGDEIGGDEGFEGNPQSFRIVTRLEVKNENLRGLDLTRASLNAILKYPWGRGPEDSNRHEKWGYYPPEQEAFEFAREMIPDGHEGPSLEAQVMDWADEVTYAVHDVDDFYQAGYIPLDQIIQETAMRDEFLEEDAVRKIFDDDEHDFDEERARDFFDRLDQDEFYPPTLKTPFQGSRQQRADLKGFSSWLISRFLMINPGDEHVPGLEIDTSGDHPRLDIDPQLRLEVDLLRALADVYVFGASPLLSQQAGHSRIVKALFDEFHEASERGSGKRRLLPGHLQDLADHLEGREDQGDVSEAEAKALRIRLAGDAVASLNERQAYKLYREVRGVAPGSVRRSNVS
jgi:dGTPase